MTVVYICSVGETQNTGEMDIRFHDLRHTAATLMLGPQRINIRTVSEVLGHADISTTLRIYAHVLDSMRQEVADKMDEMFVVQCGTGGRMDKMTKSIRVIVAHGGYGCDTGCCGHWVELADSEDEEEIGGFQFTHPYGEDKREWALRFAQEMVTKEYGADHVVDLDWENSFICED